MIADRVVVSGTVHFVSFGAADSAPVAHDRVKLLMEVVAAESLEHFVDGRGIDFHGFGVSEDADWCQRGCARLAGAVLTSREVLEQRVP